MVTLPVAILMSHIGGTLGKAEKVGAVGTLQEEQLGGNKDAGLPSTQSAHVHSPRRVQIRSQECGRVYTSMQLSLSVSVRRDMQKEHGVGRHTWKCGHTCREAATVDAKQVHKHLEHPEERPEGRRLS